MRLIKASILFAFTVAFVLQSTAHRHAPAQTPEEIAQECRDAWSQSTAYEQCGSSATGSPNGGAIITGEITSDQHTGESEITCYITTYCPAGESADAARAEVKYHGHPSEIQNLQSCPTAGRPRLCTEV